MDPQPTPPTSADPGFENALRALGEIASAARNEPLSALPPLKMVKEKGALEEFFDRLSEAIGRWLQERFGGSTNVDLVLMKQIISVAIWALVVLFALSLVFIVYRLWRNRRAPAPVLRAPAGLARSTTDDELARRLTMAIADGEISLASRLRWRLFLKRTQQLASVTPREYFARKDESLHAQAYDLMFRARASDLPAYRAWDEALMSREPKS